MPKYTPMIEQYLSIKAEAPDAILMFRLGDFYEMFFEDGITAARELEITLTGRDGGAEERIPMCGVPHHSVDNYIHRLVDKGYKVAICDQVEDPAVAKGVVKREIVRIVTPGTLIDDKMLAASVNNYIVAVTEQGGHYGIAACDLSTGELLTISIEPSEERLMDELYVYKPVELIGDKRLLELAGAILPVGSRPLRSEPWTEVNMSLLDGRLGELDRPLHHSASYACALLLQYLHHTQKRSLAHIGRIIDATRQPYMVLDPYTRRNLELTETVRDRSRSGTLIWLLDSTVTSIGARLLRRWIEKPLIDLAAIEERLEAVDALVEHFIARGDVRVALKEIYDLERLVGRIAYGNANARDLIMLRKSLEQVTPVVRACQEAGSTTIHQLIDELDDCDDIRGWIDHAIDENAPVSIREGGMIKAGFSASLDQYREASASGKQWMAELEQAEKEATGIRSLKMGYNKVFGYYIEVTKANLHLLPEGRYERKQTLAGAERFVTPELKEKEALILEAEDRMVGLEYELFVELRDRIAVHIPRLQKLAGIVAQIDVLQSLAEASSEHGYKRPVVTEQFDLVIRDGRHPVVEAVMQDHRFIANDANLSHDTGSVLLITGPNMAGKSTYMRQVAILCVMAHIGCFVPAEYARIPLIDRIFTRIGAADDLIGGQSTFMVEMTDIRVMTESATQRSLIIIDELGRGTSTSEGMAIAQAVIEYIHDRIGCKTLVSTHFHEMAVLEQSLSSLKNGRMAVSESEGQVTFLRKLVEGAADTSYGIYCAMIAGLPGQIIQRSYELLSKYSETGMLQSDQEFVPLSKGKESVVQLSLFESQEGRTGKAHQPKKSGADLTNAKLVEMIQRADLMNMTPLQAMQFVQDLKQVVSTPAAFSLKAD